MSKESYFKMTNLANNEGEICLFGEISQGWGRWDDEANSATNFKTALDDLGNVSKIYVNINSLGGSVFEGQAIYSMLKRHDAEIHVRIEGVAASIATVIAMAGDVIEIPSNAQFMIHNPATGVWGGVEDLTRAINMLETATETIASTYHEKTGLPVDEIKELMAAETWYSGSDAVAAGFGTNLTDPVDMAASFNAGKELLNLYKHAPKELVNQKTPEVKTSAAAIDYDLLADKVAQKLNTEAPAAAETPKNKTEKRNSLKNALAAISKGSF